MVIKGRKVGEEMDREKVVSCLEDLEQIMITRQEICPSEELQYWIELQEGLAEAITLLKQRDVIIPYMRRSINDKSELEEYLHERTEH